MGEKHHRHHTQVRFSLSLSLFPFARNTHVFYGWNPTSDRSQKKVTHNVIPTADRERHAMSDEIRVRVQRNVRRRIIAIRVPVDFDHRVSVYSDPRVQVREGQTLHRTRRPSKKLEI